MILDMRARLLSKYMLREFLPPFAVGLFIFTLLLVVNQLFLLMDLYLNRGVDLFIILKMVGLVLPMFFPLSIPMAALLAALWSYGRLSEDGEITALKSSGCSLFLYSWPNLALGLALSLTLVYFNMELAPLATMEFKTIHYAVAQQNPLALFAPKVMNNFGEYKIYVEKMDRRKKKLTGVSIYKLNPDTGPTRILAPAGEVTSEPGEGLTIRLMNGAIHQPGQRKESQYTITKFDGFSLRVPTETEEKPRAVTSYEMTADELEAKAAQAEREHASPAGWRTEKNRRIAVAFAPLAFILLGIALGMRVRRGSRSLGIGMSLIVILVYYGLLFSMVTLSSRGIFSPLLLTWAPNFIAFAAGGELWRRAAAL